MRIAIAFLLVAGSAHADVRYVMQRGETLEHVATAHGCSVEAVMRANNVKTTLIRAGTRIEIPDCSLRMRARTRTTAANARDPDAQKARAALAVIDGASWTLDTQDEPSPAPVVVRVPRVGAKLPSDEGYKIRRPTRAYGAPHVIEHLRSTIAVVRALYSDVHTLAIGDLSAEHGGKLDNHVSHRTGLDVDVGFYFRRVPTGYPDVFATADSNLDIEATWALLTAFARTAALDDGVEMIFLDHAVQRRLYDYAHKRGTPDDDLAAILQYPRGKDTQAGLVRHWPNHADHLHVRFKSLR